MNFVAQIQKQILTLWEVFKIFFFLSLSLSQTLSLSLPISSAPLFWNAISVHFGESQLFSRLWFEIVHSSFYCNTWLFYCNTWLAHVAMIVVCWWLAKLHVVPEWVTQSASPLPSWMPMCSFWLGESPCGNEQACTWWRIRNMMVDVTGTGNMIDFPSSPVLILLCFPMFSEHAHNIIKHAIPFLRLGCQMRV